MKTRLFFTAIIALTLTFFSCSSDEDGNNTDPTEQEIINEEPIVETAGFKWKENSGNFIVADSAFFASQWNTIKAYKAEKFVEINLTAGTAGTYPVGTANAISMLANNDVYIAGTGTVTVSEDTAGKMSGTFTSAGAGAGITGLEGAFEGIDVR